MVSIGSLVKGTDSDGSFRAGRGAHIGGVVGFAGRVVAVGGERRLGAAAVWTSEEGVAWQRIAHDENRFGGRESQEMRAVAAKGEVAVAVGRDGRHTAMWASQDGREWQRLPGERDVMGSVEAVVAGGPGMVAVGLNSALGVASAWASEDGAVWMRVPHREDVFGSRATPQTADDAAVRRRRLQMMNDVAAGPGGVVAVGVDGYQGAGQLRAAAAWFSDDGLTWQRVPHDEEAFGVLPQADATVKGANRMHMSAVVAGGPGFVAAGQDQREGSVLWASSDGLTWQRIPDPEGVFGGAGQHSVSSLAVGERGGLIAVGFDHRESVAAVWLSDDGWQWERMPHDEKMFGATNWRQAQEGAKGGEFRHIVSVATVDRRVVMVGGEMEGTQTKPAVWLGQEDTG